MVLDSGRNEGRILCQVGENEPRLSIEGGEGREEGGEFKRANGGGDALLPNSVRVSAEGVVVGFYRSSRISGKIAWRTLKKEERKRKREKKKTKGSLFHLVHSQPLGKKLFQLWLPISRVFALETKVCLLVRRESKLSIITIDRGFLRFGKNLEILKIYIYTAK